MSAVEDAVTAIAISVARGVAEADGRGIPIEVLIAAGCSVGISIGLATAIADIAAARAILHELEATIERGITDGPADRARMSRVLREAAL